MARILVIEDSEDERRSLVEVLARAGHQVCAAPNGKAALSLLREQQVEIVITDMIMPEMDGIETIMALRQEYPQIRIIAMSEGGVISSENYLRMARCLGAHRILPKPFAPGDILVAIQPLLDPR